MDIELRDPPCDGISKISFTKSSSHSKSGFLIASSWDSQIYCYDANRNKSLVRISSGSPLLSCVGDFEDPNVIFSADLDGSVKKYTIDRSEISTVGRHQEAASCLATSAYVGLLISGSWDKCVIGWDHRSSKKTFSSDVEKKIYSLDCGAEYLVVGAADRCILVYDLRRPDTPMQKRESSLRYQTRSITCSPNGKGISCAALIV